MGAFKCSERNTCLFFGGQETPSYGMCKGKENFCCNPQSPNPYQNAPRRPISGNGGAVYQTVQIRREHLTDPSIYGVDPTVKDNSMQVDTAVSQIVKTTVTSSHAIRSRKVMTYVRD